MLRPSVSERDAALRADRVVARKRDLATDAQDIVVRFRNLCWLLRRVVATRAPIRGGLVQKAQIVGVGTILSILRRLIPAPDRDRQTDHDQNRAQDRHRHPERKESPPEAEQRKPRPESNPMGHFFIRVQSSYPATSTTRFSSQLVFAASMIS